MILEAHGRTFHGLEDTLQILGLSNMSLYHVRFGPNEREYFTVIREKGLDLLFFIFQIPILPLHQLRTLYLANNRLSTVPSDMAANMTSLRHLDLSYNELSSVPLITHTLPELKSLSLAGNPITTIANTSFLGLADSLEELEIRRLPLNVFEVTQV